MDRICLTDALRYESCFSTAPGLRNQSAALINDGGDKPHSDNQHSDDQRRLLAIVLFASVARLRQLSIHIRGNSKWLLGRRGPCRPT